MNIPENTENVGNQMQLGQDGKLYVNFGAKGVREIPQTNEDGGLEFTEVDFIPMGGGFYKLPVPLSGSACVVAVKLETLTGSYQVTPQWENGFLINFGNNNEQIIYVKIG